MTDETLKENACGFSGGCLCGAVTYKSKSPPHLTAHCHCVDCRKSSGSGHGTHLVASEADYSVEGVLTSYDHAADSGNIVTRSFCPTCGCAIHSTNSGMPGMIFPRASSLDDMEVAKPQMIVYASRAASWDHMDPALPSFPELPEGGPDQAIADAAR